MIITDFSTPTRYYSTIKSYYQEEKDGFFQNRLFLLYFEYSESIKHRRNRYKYNEYGCNVFNHRNKQSLFLNFAENSISSIMLLGLMTYLTNMLVISATIGIMTLLLIKSKKSRKFIPKILILLHNPLPKDEGTPSTMATANTARHETFLFHKNLRYLQYLR